MTIAPNYGAAALVVLLASIIPCDVAVADDPASWDLMGGLSAGATFDDDGNIGEMGIGMALSHYVGWTSVSAEAEWMFLSRDIGDEQIERFGALRLGAAVQYSFVTYSPIVGPRGFARVYVEAGVAQEWDEGNFDAPSRTLPFIGVGGEARGLSEQIGAAYGNTLGVRLGAAPNNGIWLSLVFINGGLSW